MAKRQELIAGVDDALAGHWEAAHRIAQSNEDDRDFCWLHACLHKIEGDEANARYWYRRSGHAFEAYPDPKAELAAIKAALTY
jgi:hypothetical protein